MSAELSGYDVWKTGENEPDAVHCVECSRAVGATGDAKQDHDIACSEHARYAERMAKGAASAVRMRLKGAIGTIGDMMRFVDVVENKSHPMTYTYADGRKKKDGVLVTARVWVSNAEIEEHL